MPNRGGIFVNVYSCKMALLRLAPRLNGGLVVIFPAPICRLAGPCPPETRAGQESICLASLEARRLNFGPYETGIRIPRHDRIIWFPGAGGTAQVPFLPDA